MSVKTVNYTTSTTKTENTKIHTYANTQGDPEMRAKA